MSASGLLRLHLLGASGRLEPSARAICDTVSTAFRETVALLDLGEDPVDVVIRDAPAVTVPELGIGGAAPDPWTVFIGLDPRHEEFDRVVGVRLAHTLSHELHHLARRRAGCRGTTLWDAIVHEGLADRFVSELHRTDPPPWSLSVTGTSLRQLRDRALAESASATYDHALWFHGTHTADVPRWAGYALGWTVVGEYLQCHPGARASTLIGVPASAFAGSGRVSSPLGSCENAGDDRASASTRLR